MINQEWDIKPRSMVCGKCQAPFADNQEYVAADLRGGGVCAPRLLFGLLERGGAYTVGH